MAARMLKDISGRFTGKAPDPENDWKAEPLVWERVGDDEPEPVAKVEPAIQPSGKTDEAGMTISLVNSANEPVTMIGVGQRRKRGQRSDSCSRCGGERDSAKSYYCKACRAEYMRERRSSV